MNDPHAGLEGSQAPSHIGAVDELLPEVYDELRVIAHRCFQRQSPGHTLEPTALVHEAYLKIIGRHRDEGRPRDRVHTIAIAATAMRQVLINHARDKNRQKRGGGWQRVRLDAVTVGATEDIDFEAFERALSTLEGLQPRQARIVELRYLGGLSIEECASSLGIASRTVKLDWQMARAWLSREIERLES